MAARAVWLVAEFALAALDYLFQVAARRSGDTRAARARWLQRGCRRVLRVFNVAWRTSSIMPTRGLLVCNHLSYLDIVVLGAAAPAVFVAKHDVRRWPVLGWFACLAGTVFVQREKRHDAGRATREILETMDQGALVVLFPEGTSTGGDTVLPFKSALLAPATQPRHPLTAAFIRYTLAEGSVADDVCYWRDMTLGPHLLNLLGKRRLVAQVLCSPVHGREADRKALARRLHADVVRLKAVCCSRTQP